MIFMKDLYGLLMQFTNGTTPCRDYLLKNFPTEKVERALSLGYIIEIRKNAYNDSVYAITDLGRRYRDN